MMRYKKKELFMNWLNVAYQSVRLKEVVLSPLHNIADRFAVMCMMPIAVVLYVIRK